MYDISLTPGDVDFLREVVDFIDEILDAVELQTELAREACE